MGRGGKRKPFIEKSKATTYNLLYRASEVQVDGEDAGPERELVEVSRGVGIGRPDAEAATGAAVQGSRYPPGHPLSFLQEPPPDNMSEQRRQELIQLGFPDDGYDYLKHMRAPGRGGTANLEGQTADADAFAGPSIFVPATRSNTRLEDDLKVFDASRLTLHQAAEDEDSAVDASGGVTAFSRQRERLRQAEAQEFEEMERYLEDLEEEEEGDLEDDFIMSATQAAAEEEAERQAAAARDSAHSGAGHSAADYSKNSDSDAASSRSSQSDWAEDVEQDAQQSVAGAKPGSIASTYWRPERSDRKNLLSVVDERFEHLALDYDESDIGSLDEEDPRANGHADLDAFGALMDDFLAHHDESGAAAAPEAQRLHGAAYKSAAEAAISGCAADRALATKTLERAKEVVREGDTDGPPVQLRELPIAAQDRWDCESVLSLRSNLDNHPASIAEPQSRARSRQQMLGSERGSSAFIPLSRHTGIPLGYSNRDRHSRANAQAAALQAAESAVENGNSSDGSDGGGFIAPPRRKGETAAEKQARKQLVKEAKRAARAAKKETKVMYKQEFSRQQRAMATPAPATISLP